MEKQSEQQELKDIIATREDGFGHRFKTARDEKNLSIEDVARELHLGKKIILALESEDHTQLPAAAFVCGYIRNYAKFLKIQAEPLIEYYKNERSDDTLEPALKIIKGKDTSGHSIFSASFSAIVVPVITLLILLALAAGGWGIWLYVANNKLINSSESVESEAVIVDAVIDAPDNNDAGMLLLPELNEPYVPPEEERLEQSNSTLENSLSAEASISAEGSQSAEGSLPAEGSLSAEGSQPTEGSLSVESSLQAEGSSPADSLSADRPTQTAIDSQPVIIADNRLVLEFSGDSWVSIKDADNKILATGLKTSSKVLYLEGKMPYKVFLGDARVVKISLNGKVFDHSKYINEKNIARFNVK